MNKYDESVHQYRQVMDMLRPKGSVDDLPLVAFVQSDKKNIPYVRYDFVDELVEILVELQSFHNKHVGLTGDGEVDTPLQALRKIKDDFDGLSTETCCCANMGSIARDDFWEELGRILEKVLAAHDPEHEELEKPPKIEEKQLECPECLALIDCTHMMQFSIHTCHNCAFDLEFTGFELLSLDV